MDSLPSRSTAATPKNQLSMMMLSSVASVTFPTQREWSQVAEVGARQYTR